MRIELQQFDRSKNYKKNQPVTSIDLKSVQVGMKSACEKENSDDDQQSSGHRRAGLSLYDEPHNANHTSAYQKHRPEPHKPSGNSSARRKEYEYDSCGEQQQAYEQNGLILFPC